MVNDAAIIDRSGQRWKIRLVQSAALAGGIMLLLAFANGVKGPIWLGAFAIGTLLTCGSVIWGSLSVRCPNCLEKLYWRAIRERGPTASYTWLLNVRVCPACGYDSGRSHEPTS